MKTTMNTLVSNIAERAMELANQKMMLLRMDHPEAISPSDWRTIIDNRGECINAILLEEFQVEFDFDISNE